MKWAVWFSTGGGVGFSPRMPGTMGSLAGLILFIFFRRLSPLWFFLILTVLFLLGVYAADRSEPFFKKKDASEIVIDEILAILFVLFFTLPTALWWLAAFGAFRFFDILKPPPTRLLEKLPGGWGVMMDDVMAAIYSIGLLKILEEIDRYWELGLA